MIVITDRELLEAAARAAGYGPVWYMEDGGTPYVGTPYKLGGPVDYRTFNPLTDDGDAFRLASKLKLNTAHGDFSVCVNDESEIEEAALVRHEGERTEVLRRLVVRAAAEMGKT